MEGRCFIIPPKAKFTREEIIHAALDITRTCGIGGVTARELGARLGSSARPIFSVFSGMDEVWKETVEAAQRLYDQYIEEGFSQNKPFKGVGMQYIRFAMEEPRLFQMLFMTGGSTSPDIEKAKKPDQNAALAVETVEKLYHLDAQKAQKLCRHLWIYTHGIAALCATKVCTFSMEEVSVMLTEAFNGILQSVKS